MALTRSSSVAANSIKELLEANAPSLGLKAVYYGDQDRIGITPCVTVEAGDVDLDITGTGMWMAVTINVGIMVYFAKIASDSKLKYESDIFAENIIDAIHQDANKTLGGLVINGFIRQIQPGVAIRGGARLRAHRLSWRGISRAHL